MAERGRHSIRLPGYDYAAAGGYFVTIATYKQTALFGRIIDDAVELNSLGKLAQDCWQEIPSHFPRVELDTFIVMPNHLHGILLIHEKSIPTRVGAYAAAQRRMLRPYNKIVRKFIRDHLVRLFARTNPR